MSISSDKVPAGTPVNTEENADDAEELRRSSRRNKRARVCFNLNFVRFQTQCGLLIYLKIFFCIG